MSKSSKREYSQTPKAIREAKRRKEEHKAKRFNDPLRIFLERRYPKVLSEFTELYEYVDFLNPTKKNLCRTATFKEWMSENPPPLKTTLPMPSVSPVFETSLPTMVNMEKSSEAVNIKQETPHSSSGTSTIVSAIIDELFGPDGLPDEEEYADLPTLNGDDEGIELNHFDEWAYDIKPFDFF